MLTAEKRDCHERYRHLQKAAEGILYQAGDKRGAAWSDVGFLGIMLIRKFCQKAFILIKAIVRTAVNSISNSNKIKMLSSLGIKAEKADCLSWTHNYTK